MNAQASLFDAPTTAGRVRATDAQTSADAAKKIRDEAYCAVVKAHGQHPEGLTDDELVALLPHLRSHTVKSARSRVKNAGLVEATDQKRLSVCGSPMIVWRVVRKGHGWAA